MSLLSSMMMRLVPSEAAISATISLPALGDERLVLGRGWFLANGLRGDERLMRFSKRHVSFEREPVRGQLLLWRQLVA